MIKKFLFYMLTGDQDVIPRLYNCFIVDNAIKSYIKTSPTTRHDYE
jgi:hypothetical protein